MNLTENMDIKKVMAFSDDWLDKQIKICKLSRCHAEGELQTKINIAYQILTNEQSYREYHT